MSFEHGSVSFRVFKAAVGSTLEGDVVPKLAKDAIQSMDAMPAEGSEGWATGRHLLDRNITDESVVIAGRIRVSLTKAERKIPSALFKAECKQEELATMAAKGAQFLKRAERAEIAKSVRERMLPSMPPTLSGIDLVSTPDGCLATASSVAQVDRIIMNWHKSTGQSLVPYTPSAAAFLLGNCDIRTLQPTSFSTEVKDEDVEQDIGTEFLTWLWYYSEACGGIVRVGDSDIAFALDGPFTFVHEGAGAHEIVVRKGNPGIAEEAKSALVAGKKLKKAKLTVARGDEQWLCSIDGSEWTFGSLKMPKGDAVDPVGNFEQRMLFVGTFVEAIEGAFKKFLAIRTDQTQWGKEVAGIRLWVSDRIGKA